MEVFPGAHKLSVISRRPIQFIALHGLEKLWHADEDIGMHVTCKDVRVRGYAHPRHYETSQEFVETFQTVVGYFGAHGMDHPRVEEWLDGAALSNQKLLETASSNTMAVPTIMDNAEKAILTALERERQRKLLLERVVTAEDEPSKHEAVPIGVHRGKSLSTKHTMVP